MKKILSIFLTFVLLFSSLGAFSTSADVNNTFKYGNVNSDDSINNKDLGLLMQYLNGWDVDIDIAAADVNGDDGVNNKDYGLLMQYLNGWDVVLGKPVPDIDYDWKSHSEDYKLLAFTFDDGPKNLMESYVQYFAEFEGAGTFFVNGYNIKGDSEYNKMQSAINYGWDIGNHGDKHLVATIGGENGGEATYDELNADITNLIHKLEDNLKFRDGSPYEVSLYRPPNIKPTENTFKICAENNLAVIWLKHDALDWGSNSKESSYNVFKTGIGTWQDGDVILCHETSQNTYDIIQEVLPEYYEAGYRFCSITEFMELRGITIDQISGKLNEVNGNRGMVTNILDAVKAGNK